MTPRELLAARGVHVGQSGSSGAADLVRQIGVLGVTVGIFLGTLYMPGRKRT